MTTQVYIIGGGAAGLMAAIHAARAGAKVTVLEHGQQPGRKLLATGNGKCNLSNCNIRREFYHCRDLDFLDSVLGGFSLENTLDFFTSIGVYTRNRDGLIYPYSQQASAVLQLMLIETQHLGIKYKTQSEILGLEFTGKDWLIHTPGWDYRGDSVIVATGSPASNIPGADTSGYELAQNLGHKIIQPLPALVPLICTGVSTKTWAGVRMEGVIKGFSSGKMLAQAEGELQFTDYGVSGIPVFQISSSVVRELHKGNAVNLELDLLPKFTSKQLKDMLQQDREKFPHKTQRELLLGLIPEKMAQTLEGNDPVRMLKNLSLKVTGSREFAYAQVCSGGVDVEELNRGTLESKLYPRLYFAGEIIDVDGLCGGYNLQWAWSSGAIAGKMAAGEKNDKN